MYYSTLLYVVLYVSEGTNQIIMMTLHVKMPLSACTAQHLSSTDTHNIQTQCMLPVVTAGEVFLRELWLIRSRSGGGGGGHVVPKYDRDTMTLINPSLTTMVHSGACTRQLITMWLMHVSIYSLSIPSLLSIIFLSFPKTKVAAAAVHACTQSSRSHQKNKMYFWLLGIESDAGAQCDKFKHLSWPV